MILADFAPSIIETIAGLDYDCILEKHEGPGHWSSVLKYYNPEISRLGEFNVLLPVSQDQHPNISLLRHIPSADGKTLLLFLKDTTYANPSEDERFIAGRIAVCERIPDTDIFIATVYHEWFILENPGLS
ncbi:MAG: hypothetical protein JXA10_18285 [Anaerolineae bacterium]|nr:hypothetical protein [Anaerolineae bacterium]